MFFCKYHRCIEFSLFNQLTTDPSNRIVMQREFEVTAKDFAGCSSSSSEAEPGHVAGGANSDGGHSYGKGRLLPPSSSPTRPLGYGSYPIPDPGRAATFSATCAQFTGTATHPAPRYPYGYGGLTLQSFGSVSPSFSPPFTSPYFLFPNLAHHAPRMPSEPGEGSPQPKRRRLDDLEQGDSNYTAKTDVGAALPLSSSSGSCPAASSLLPTPPPSGSSSSDRSETGSPFIDYSPLHLTLGSSAATPPLGRNAPPAASSVNVPQVEYPQPVALSDARPPAQKGVHVTLSKKSEDLWRLFCAANTEMIVTKGGR